MLGLYIHVPFCASKCNYCDFNSFKLDKELKIRYIADLKKEISIYKEILTNKNMLEKKITSVFLGGGTPSILNPAEIQEIFDNVYSNFNISSDAEVTMECNPGTLDIEKLKVMKDIGVNRLSIGLQAVQDHHLKYIGRIHSYKEFEKNYKQALELGFKNINIDLMYALPNQSIKEWKESLEKVVNLNPSHISAYSLILEEGTKLNDMYEKKEFRLMDENTDIELYNYTIKYLSSKGYNQYEISNYAKNGFECKHNILYWRCKEYIGIGPGASGYIENTRYNNINSLDEYHNILNQNKRPLENEDVLSDRDKIQEKIFMGLRMNNGIVLDDFKDEFKVDLSIYYGEEINKLEKRNLIYVDEIGIRLTQKGREISNSIFIEFLD